MNKKNLLQKMANVADELDMIGKFKEANVVMNVMKRLAQLESLLTPQPQPQVHPMGPQQPGNQTPQSSPVYGPQSPPATTQNYFQQAGIDPNSYTGSAEQNEALRKVIDPNAPDFYTAYVKKFGKWDSHPSQRHATLSGGAATPQTATPASPAPVSTTPPPQGATPGQPVNMQPDAQGKYSASQISSWLQQGVEALKTNMTKDLGLDHDPNNLGGKLQYIQNALNSFAGLPVRDNNVAYNKANGNTQGNGISNIAFIKTKLKFPLATGDTDLLKQPVQSLLNEATEISSDLTGHAAAGGRANIFTGQSELVYRGIQEAAAAAMKQIDALSTSQNQTFAPLQ